MQYGHNTGNRLNKAHTTKKKFKKMESVFNTGHRLNTEEKQNKTNKQKNGKKEEEKCNHMLNTVRAKAKT